MKLKKISEVLKQPRKFEDNLGRVLPFQGGRYRLDDDNNVVDSGVINRYPNPIDLFLQCNKNKGGETTAPVNTITDFFDVELYTFPESYAAIGEGFGTSNTYRTADHGHVIHMSSEGDSVVALYEDGFVLRFSAMINPGRHFSLGVYSEALYSGMPTYLEAATHAFNLDSFIFTVDGTKTGVTKCESVNLDNSSKAVFDLPTKPNERFKGGAFARRYTIGSGEEGEGGGEEGGFEEGGFEEGGFEEGGFEGPPPVEIPREFNGGNVLLTLWYDEVKRASVYRAWSITIALDGTISVIEEAVLNENLNVTMDIANGRALTLCAIKESFAYFASSDSPCGFVSDVLGKLKVGVQSRTDTVRPAVAFLPFDANVALLLQDSNTWYNGTTKSHCRITVREDWEGGGPPKVEYEYVPSDFQIPKQIIPDFYDPLYINGYSDTAAFEVVGASPAAGEILFSGSGVVTLNDDAGSIKYTIQDAIKAGDDFNFGILASKGPLPTAGKLNPILMLKNEAGEDVFAIGTGSDNRLGAWTDDQGVVSYGDHAQDVEFTISIDVRWNAGINKHDFYVAINGKTLTPKNDLVLTADCVGVKLVTVGNNITIPQNPEFGGKGFELLSDFHFVKRSVPGVVQTNIFNLANRQLPLEPNAWDGSIALGVPRFYSYGYNGTKEVSIALNGWAATITQNSEGIRIWYEYTSMLSGQAPDLTVDMSDITGYNGSLFWLANGKLAITANWKTYALVTFRPMEGTYIADIETNPAFNLSAVFPGATVQVSTFNLNKGCFVICGVENDLEFLAEVNINPDFTPGAVSRRSNLPGPTWITSFGQAAYIGKDRYLVADNPGSNARLMLCDVAKNDWSVVKQTLGALGSSTERVTEHKGILIYSRPGYGYSTVSVKDDTAHFEAFTSIDNVSQLGVGLVDRELKSQHLKLGAPAPVEPVGEDETIHPIVVGPTITYTPFKTDAEGTPLFLIRSLTQTPMSLTYLSALATNPVIAQDEYLLDLTNLTASVDGEETKWTYNSPNIVMVDGTPEFEVLPHMQIVKSLLDGDMYSLSDCSKLRAGTNRREVVVKLFNGNYAEMLAANVAALYHKLPDALTDVRYGFVDGDETNWAVENLVVIPDVVEDASVAREEPTIVSES